MKFIEISPTTTVNKDEVCWINSTNGGLSCTVYVGGKEYESDIPYQTLIMLLQQGGDNEAVMDKLNKYLEVATVQTF
jgi:hypothetical protein